MFFLDLKTFSFTINQFLYLIQKIVFNIYNFFIIINNNN